MMRSLLLTGWLFLAPGIVLADEFTGTLSKVEDNKVTFTQGTGKKKKTTTLIADEKCRVVVAKYDKKTKKIEAGDEINGGLKHPLFQKLDTDAVEAWIRTDAGNERILELRLFQSAKKRK